MRRPWRPPASPGLSPRGSPVWRAWSRAARPPKSPTPSRGSGAKSRPRSSDSSAIMQARSVPDLLSKEPQMKGKVALVTGGTSGIGRATAVALGRAGASVVVAGRREAEGRETVGLIKKAGGQASVFRADVSREADLRALVEHAVKTFGRLDIAVNNAGVELVQPVVEASPDDCRRIFDVNVVGVLLSMKHEIP